MSDDYTKRRDNEAECYCVSDDELGYRYLYRAGYDKGYQDGLAFRSNWQAKELNTYIDQLEAKLRVAIQALEWYASGEPTREHPYKEFGCGCCRSSVVFDDKGEFEPDYEDMDIQGKLAIETLKLLKEKP